MMEACSYCDLPATWYVGGYAEGPTDSGFATTAVRNPVCDEHKREFEDWDRDEQTGLHGFVGVTAITPIGTPNV